MTSNNAHDRDSQVDAMVNRATEQFLGSSVVRFVFFSLFGVAALVGVGVGVSAYQVKTVSDHAAQAKTEIDQSVASLKQSVALSSRDVANLSNQVNGLEADATRRVNALLEKLDSNDLKNLGAARDSLKSLQDALQNQARQEATLEDYLQELNKRADTVLAFTRLSKEIDEANDKIGRLETPVTIGRALTSPFFLTFIGVLMLLAGAIGGLISRKKPA
ncbi:MAG: hypothetical protein LAO20_21870 [Acidobacteriia bacterium]|nr:hypothetical protein [Terriglobia bacterium]